MRMHTIIYASSDTFSFLLQHSVSTIMTVLLYCQTLPHHFMAASFLVPCS
jgi:hypothetical protein